MLLVKKVKTKSKFLLFYVFLIGSQCIGGILRTVTKWADVISEHSLETPFVLYYWQPREYKFTMGGIIFPLR